MSQVCKQKNNEYSISCLQNRIQNHLSTIKLAILGITIISIIAISGLSYTFYHHLDSFVIHTLEKHFKRHSLQSVQTLKANVKSILGSFQLEYQRGTWKASLEAKAHSFAYMLRHFHENYNVFLVNKFLDQLFTTTFNSVDNVVIIFTPNEIRYIYPKSTNITQTSLKKFIQTCQGKFSSFLHYKFKTKSGRTVEVNGYVVYLEDLDYYLFYGQKISKIYNRIRNRAISAITLFNLNLNKNDYVLLYDLKNKKVIKDSRYFSLPNGLKNNLYFFISQQTETNQLANYKDFILQAGINDFFKLKYLVIKNTVPDKMLIQKPITKIKEQLLKISLLANVSTVGAILIIVIIIFIYVKKVLLELSKINASLISALQQQKIFLASVSHEIRTPLNGIIGFLELLNVSKLSPKEKEYVKYCLAASNQLLDMVNEILDTLKAHGQQLTLNEKEFDLDQTIQEVIASLSSRVRSEVKLNYFPPNLNYYVIGDEKRIRQCFYNLISNALKFTLKGSVTIKNLSIEDIENKVKFVFIIKDTGIGIDLEVQDKLFQPFVQAESKIHQEVAGTGLGLFLCRSLAKLMQGNVWFESTPGKGTTFFLSFVVKKGKPKTKDQPKSKTVQSLDCSQLKVLVADDVKTNQMVISNLLQKMFKVKQVDIAQDGQEAVNLALKNDYDLIFMDIKMPKLNGIEAVQKIRQAGINVPIYILSADVLKDAQEEAIQAGADGFLEKPINLEKLKTVLKKIMNKEPNQKS